MDDNKTALVLGATGGIGGAVARRLLAGGWQVRALVRDPARAGLMAGVRWIGGDALDRAAVVAAADGARLIVHAVNPPGYRDWSTLVLPMLDNTIAAARSSGARVLLPGNVYNYGAGAPQPLREDTSQQPSSRKGAIRVEMERRLRDAGVKALVVRAGDFFGPRSGNSWFSQGVITPGRPVRAVTNPGDAGVGHAWAYLPDVADTMVRLAEQEPRLGVFECFHFRGHWDADGSALLAAVRRVCGDESIKDRRLPWLALRLLSPFVTVFREMAEMRYLWRAPFELDNARLVRFLGAEPHTPLDEAIALTLDGLGCLPRPAAQPA